MKQPSTTRNSRHPYPSQEVGKALELNFASFSELGPNQFKAKLVSIPAPIMCIMIAFHLFSLVDLFYLLKAFFILLKTTASKKMAQKIFDLFINTVFTFYMSGKS